GVLGSLAKAGFVFSSNTPRISTVDRARAFTYHARSKDGSYQSELTFVFRGRSQIEVLCQYADSRITMQRACGRVLATLQIRTVTAPASGATRRQRGSIAGPPTKGDAMVERRAAEAERARRRAISTARRQRTGIAGPPFRPAAGTSKRSERG